MKRLFLFFLLLLHSSFPAVAGTPAGIVLYAETKDGIQLLLADHTASSKRGWAAFGGAAEDKETPAETAARETEEETHGYFTRAEMLKKIGNQKPSMDGGFALFFVKVDHVPIDKLLATPIPSNKAYHERGPWAWVPWRAISPHATKLPDKPDAAILDARLLPKKRNTSYLWGVWLHNLRTARAQSMIPWEKASTGSDTK